MLFGAQFPRGEEVQIPRTVDGSVNRIPIIEIVDTRVTTQDITLTSPFVAITSIRVKQTHATAVVTMNKFNSATALTTGILLEVGGNPIFDFGSYVDGTGVSWVVGITRDSDYLLFADYWNVQVDTGGTADLTTFGAKINFEAPIFPNGRDVIVKVQQNLSAVGVSGQWAIHGWKWDV